MHWHIGRPFGYVEDWKGWAQSLACTCGLLNQLRGNLIKKIKLLLNAQLSNDASRLCKSWCCHW